MCLKISNTDKNGIIADRDIPCIKLLLGHSAPICFDASIELADDAKYVSVCMGVPVELGKLMVATGESYMFSDDGTINLEGGFIHAYMCEPKDLETVFRFSIGVRCYIPKGNVYYVDMNYPDEVCSPSLFITDEILFNYKDYKNDVLK